MYKRQAEGDTLAVRYTLGAVEEKKLVPIVVEQERFETLILNRLTDTQKKTLERYYMLVDLDNMQDQNYRRELEVKYPAAKKGPVWVLRNNPPAPNIEDKIHEIVVMTGYTPVSYTHLSAETQTRFGSEMESLLGASARYATANREAFSQLAWSVEEYKTIEAQRAWAPRCV